ncbi:SusC/RagA family TonB-linked outer membrane protein [Sphingobacterium sp. CZ-UAM]|nr:SusC/RagA family TonB-linked outer membrane protein [Sphingobacterium sp. CZ-UAM]
MNFFSPLKRQEKDRGFRIPPAFKTLCMIKLSTLSLLSLALGAHASGTAQTVNLSLKKVRIEKVLQEISKQTDLRFFYDEKLLNSLQPVSIQMDHGPIQQALSKVLKGQNLTYQILNNTIVISEKQRTDIEITGTVRSTESALAGVTVSVEGHTTLSTKTDANGQFKLRVPENAVLVFQYMGYTTARVQIGSQRTVNMTLQASNSQLDEVVVVGYGTQRKVNLTGAVDMISSKQLESRPIANLGAGLQGLIPNLNITTSNGRASTNPEFNVRGFTSLNGGAPLILVDNIPYSPDEVARINPNDVESVSVLKDAASAAIYGARGGFGVVLITTKKAKSGQLDVNFSTNVGYRTLGKLPEFITDPYEVMAIKHEAGKPLYNSYPESAREYAKKRSLDPSLPAVTLSDNGQDWVYTGSTDWLKEAYNKTAPTYNANLSIAKKSDKIGYYLSSDYYRQDGLLKYGNDVYKRYNVRGKVDFDVTDWLQVSNNTLLTSMNYDTPVVLDAGDSFFWRVNRTNSLDVPRNPDGSWTRAGAQVLGSLQEGGRNDNRINEFVTTFSAKAALIKGIWDLNADATFRRSSGLKRSYDVPSKYKTGPEAILTPTFSNTYARNENDLTRYNVYNIYTDFHKNFGDHYLQALAGYNQEYNYNNYNYIQALNLISTTVPSIGSATGNISKDERIKDWAVQGIFARVSYSYKDKYLAEFNGRFDGSSRFPKNNRWGFFPSASAGWVISKENFFEPVKNTLAMDFLKIRGSYGSLGNQLFRYDADFPYYDAYPYMPIMDNKLADYILGNGKPPAVYAPRAVSDNFTWETIQTVNAGIDMGFFNNKLGVNFDKYTRYTKDMLVPGKELPGPFGAKIPVQNAGDLKTKGWELRLSWRDSKELSGSPFWYNVAFTLADSRSWITRFDNPTKSLGDQWDRHYVGKEIGEIWGADIVGFFEDDAAAAASKQSAMGTDDQSYKFYAGDPVFADLNGDGKVDMGKKTVDDAGDMHIVGNNSARLPYSLDLSTGWKGFDLRVFLQGIGKRDWYPGASNIYFWGVYAQPWTNPTVQNGDHWKSKDEIGYFPAVRAYSAEDNYQQLGIPNKRYMQNGAYMRVKNLTLGYTLPESVLQRIKLRKVRFFFSAENVFEISHIKVKLDPESIGSGNRAQAAYPFQRTYTFGLNVNL